MPFESNTTTGIGPRLNTKTLFSESTATEVASQPNETPSGMVGQGVVGRCAVTSRASRW
jgi:hypothetical protein